MRVAELTDALAGQRLARTVYGPRGVPLLRAGTVLTPSYIAALRAQGYTHVYVVNELAPDIVIDEAVQEATRQQAIATVARVMRQVAHGEAPALDGVQAVVDELVDELGRAGETALCLATLRSLDQYTFVHSVQVCILSLLAAAQLGYGRPALRELGVGALLHDVGKVRVPAHILQKPGPLTPEEMEEVKRHTVYGFEILLPRHEISARAAHVAYQHHERLDGSGYPRGLRGEQIHPYARIVAVADVYDAMVAERPYRRAHRPDQAAAWLRSQAGIQFEARAVEALLRRLALYPEGTVVRLGTGEVGVVSAQTADPARPVVRVLGDPEDQPLVPFEVDLAARRDLAIADVLPDVPPLLLQRHRERRRAAAPGD